MKTDTPEGLIPDPQAHALTLAEMILKASDGYEVGTVRAHREQWAIVIAALKAYAVPPQEDNWSLVTPAKIKAWRMNNASMSPNEFLELCEMALQCEQQRRFKHLANERADRAEAELAKRRVGDARG
jgi:hypothetical protein